jgi:hypothetical protein
MLVHCGEGLRKETAPVLALALADGRQPEATGGGWRREAPRSGGSDARPQKTRFAGKRRQTPETRNFAGAAVGGLATAADDRRLWPPDRILAGEGGRREVARNACLRSPQADARRRDEKAGFCADLDALLRGNDLRSRPANPACLSQRVSKQQRTTA